MNSAIQDHKIYMKRCLDLARNGELWVRPNPMVGCVIVHNGIIIGEGYHKKYGEAHAEVNAINSVKRKELLKESILYVNLEPCAHYGKTPPCADLIVNHKIPHVVIANVDPHSKVAGKGIEKLRKGGCEVITGVLEQEAYILNKFFFTYHKKNRPYIVLKWAESSDGFIDKIRDKKDPIGPNWITNEKCRQLVHYWRAQCQAIMVGANTVKKDNPALNVRYWTGQDPIRIVYDRDLNIPKKSAIYDQSVPTIVFTIKEAKSKQNLQFITLDDDKDPYKSILNYLYQINVVSLFVEGGSKLLQLLIDKDYWDEARIFKGNKQFNDGIKAPAIKNSSIEYSKMFDTQIVYMFPKTIY